MAGVDQQLLARDQIALDDFAGQVEPDHAGPGDLLKNKALASEDPAPNLCCQASSSFTDFSAQRNVSFRQITDCPSRRGIGVIVPEKRGAKAT